MSKSMIRSDRWAQVYSSANTRAPSWCPGCGHHPTVNHGAHRGDCTAEAEA